MLDALRASPHSPTGKTRGTLPFGFLDLTRKDYKYSFNYYIKEKKYKESEKYKVDKMLNNIIESMRSLLKDEEQEKAEFFTGLSSIKNVIGFTFNKIDSLTDELRKAGYNFVAMQLSDCSLRVDVEKRLSNYIGAFRIQPQRTYYRKSKLLNKVTQFGENCIDLIVEWKDTLSPKYKNLVRILREMNILHGIYFRKSSGGRFEPRIKTSELGVWSSLIDVGFGISQVLPIIVADLQLEKNSMLIVAQPEIHLHPSAQADFASYFINQVKKNDKRYVLETHSEYMLNRIRAAIVKGIINQRDVSVYYFDNAANGSKYYKISLTNDGQIKGAPKEFFETYQMEVMDIAFNA